MSNARSSIDSDSDSDLNKEEVELHAITSLTKKQQAFVKFIDELIAGGNVIDEAEQKKAAELNYEIIKIFRNNCDMIYHMITVDQLKTGFYFDDTLERLSVNDKLKLEVKINSTDNNQQFLALTNTIRLLEKIKDNIIKDNIKDEHITAKLTNSINPFVQKHCIQQKLQESAQELFKSTQPQRILLEMVKLAEEGLSKNKIDEFFILFKLSLYEGSEDVSMMTMMVSDLKDHGNRTQFALVKQKIQNGTTKCTLELAEKLVKFSDNLSIRDVSLSRKEMFQALAIGFLAVVTIGLLIGFAIASHGLILPPLLLLFGKAGAAAATSAVGTSAVANTATVVGLAGVSSLGLFMPTVLRKYWARSDMKEKAAEFKETVTPKAS